MLWITDQRLDYRQIPPPLKTKCQGFTHAASVATPPYPEEDEFILNCFISLLTLAQAACGSYSECHIHSFKNLTRQNAAFHVLWARCSSLFTSSFWCRKAFNWFHVCFHVFLFTSLAVHPDKITIATGQVAGTSSDGKVSERDWYFIISAFCGWFIGVRSCSFAVFLKKLCLRSWEAETHSLCVHWLNSASHGFKLTAHLSWCCVVCVCVFLSWQQLAPHVRVWDSVSLNTLHVLGTGFFDRALVCLAFSKSVRKHRRHT